MKEMFPIPVCATPRARSVLVGALAIWAAACSDGSAAAPSGVMGGQGGAVPSQGGMPSCSAPSAPGPAAVRRLTRTEYLNSLSELLPGAVGPSTAALLLTDPAVDGFENQIRALRPNALQIEAWSDVAATAARVALSAGPEGVLGCAPEGDQALPCVGAFVSVFGLKAFRRPLTESEKSSYVELYRGLRQELDAAGATELLVQAFLQSPQFLYRMEIGQPNPTGTRSLDSYEIATRLSYLILQSTPDDALLAAAGSAQLSHPEGLQFQIQRMLAKPAAASAFGEFVRQWLELNAVLDRGSHKDPALYPGWNAALAQAALDDTANFAGFVFRQAQPTLATLLQSAVGPVDARLTDFHGGNEGATQRAGVLTRIAFLAANARSVGGSPPLRGASIQRALLCASPPLPPADVDRSEPLPSAGVGATNRQRFESRVAPSMCKGCHAAMDGIGYGFEHFDAIGQYRVSDNGQPIDASGVLMDTGATDGPFDGAQALSARLAKSPVVIECFVARFFQYAYGRPASDSDHCALERLKSLFIASGGDVVDLVKQIALGPEFARVTAFEANTR
jgi:Protein of unknown function (DUF1592)/Protein of unknown function (DUF1588)/Protein of unknown function (DUF1595)/Protein of unknown function (DUF1585)/Protein of unknown function (DUF1587)